MPVANFAIAANISELGALYNGIPESPSKLGKWLNKRGKAQLHIIYDDKLYLK